MLDYAYFHKERLKQAWAKVAMDPQFKFIAPGSYTNLDFDLKFNTFSKVQCVSLSAKGEIIGYFDVSVDREAYYAYGLWVINLAGLPDNTFTSDLTEFIRVLFTTWNFQKLKFSVVVGDPSEITYDEFIKKYSGRIIGVNRRDIRLPDGKLYDIKLYELLRENYVNVIGVKT